MGSSRYSVCEMVVIEDAGSGESESSSPHGIYPLAVGDTKTEDVSTYQWNNV